MADDLDIINNVLATESGRIGPDIYEETVHTSPLLDMVKEADWPGGMGKEIQVMTWSRMLPADTTTKKAKRITWENIAFSADDPDGFFGGSAGTGTGGACLPPKTDLPSGFRLKSYQLQHAALETPMLCVNDLRDAFMMTETLRAMKNSMMDVTMWVLLQKYRQLYTGICTANVLISAESGFVESTTMPSGSGKTPAFLTQGALTKCYNRLVRRGAGNRPGVMKADGQPIFPLMIGSEASRLVKQESGYRDDIRWNRELVGTLLAALGAVSPPLLGFLHVNEVLPDRWNYDGEWVWVPPYEYVLDESSGQYVMEENADYETADWEDTYIFHPDVFHAVFPGSISSAGSGTEFQPIKYRGDWTWLNIQERARNPMRTHGNFRGEFTLGGKPVFTNYGYVIRHARCDLAPQYTACPTGE